MNDNILKLNATFTQNSPINIRFNNYLEEHLDSITSSILVIISGKIATGKSIFLSKITEQKNVVLINSLLDLNKKAPNLNDKDILGIDVSNFQELNIIIKQLETLKNPIIITTIEYIYLESLTNWQAFINSRKKLTKMRNAPIHLHLTQSLITANALF
ncbi:MULTISPECIES: hypothetical protein [Avibacterium]|uniref:Uncharacterized protein n=1 Tax=Avibacterium paragallinarum TaxID=728 RepID=A0ABU7QRJ9_AVIPA|nr:hypothetical protein [Avibacterium paragallinarum]